MKAGVELERQVFATSRALDFFDEPHLTTQIGYPRGRWRLALLKELVDNGLDAAEEAGVPPSIEITVTPDRIAVRDGGGGIPEDALRRTLDPGVHVSTKRQYLTPTRGRLGNALLCLYAASYVMGGNHGLVTIDTGGQRYRVEASVDEIAQVPRLDMGGPERVTVKTGTRVTADLACSTDEDEDPDAYRDLVRAYALFNPNATFTLRQEGRVETIPRTDAEWKKWMPSDPPSALWYEPEDLCARIAAQIARDRAKDGRTTVRDLLAEFRGLSGTQKRKRVLDAARLAGATLEDLARGNGLDKGRISTLLREMQRASRPVRPEALGVVAKEHVALCLRERYGATGEIKYKKTVGGDPIPSVLEVVFAVANEDDARQRTVVGVNWSPAVDSDAMLPDLAWRLTRHRVDQHDPVIVVLHLASPVVPYADTGKSRLALDLDGA